MLIGSLVINYVTSVIEILYLSRDHRNEIATKIREVFYSWWTFNPYFSHGYTIHRSYVTTELNVDKYRYRCR